MKHHFESLVRDDNRCYYWLSVDARLNLMPGFSWAVSYWAAKNLSREGVVKFLTF